MSLLCRFNLLTIFILFLIECVYCVAIDNYTLAEETAAIPSAAFFSDIAAPDETSVGKVIGLATGLSGLAVIIVFFAFVLLKQHRRRLHEAEMEEGRRQVNGLTANAAPMGHGGRAT
ncbi:hypothetical protein BZA77DRAFT_327790 [Pyronema omphalodes]|nr:hypothetical protein BZA77DRAFT_327790 [Pyronema omphalodes]